MRHILKAYLRFLGIIEILAGGTFLIIFINRLFGVMFNHDIVPEGSSMLLIVLGIILPISLFGLGLYTYFSYEFDKTVNRVIFIFTFVLHLTTGFFYLLSNYISYPIILNKVMEIFYFNNYNFSYILIVISLASFYGYYYLKNVSQ